MFGKSKIEKLLAPLPMIKAVVPLYSLFLALAHTDSKVQVLSVLQHCQTLLSCAIQKCLSSLPFQQISLHFNLPQSTGLPPHRSDTKPPAQSSTLAQAEQIAIIGYVRGRSALDLFCDIPQERSNVNQIVGDVCILATFDQLQKIYIVAQSSII